MNESAPEVRRRRGPGRPRGFEQHEVLDRALELFWAQGLSGTSVDELAGAMGLNRPSLYNAFGNKEALYRAALARFAARLEGLSEILSGGTLRESLQRFFIEAVDVYTRGKQGLGCFVMCTAPVEAIRHPDIRGDLTAVIQRIDALLADRFDRARRDEGFNGDVRLSAELAQGVLHGLALRARAGESLRALRRNARYAARVLAVSPA